MAGAGNVAGGSAAAIAGAKGSRASGRHDESALFPDIEARGSRPEGADPDPPDDEMDGHDEPESVEAPVPVATGKDIVPTGGVGFIANQIEPDRPDDPILGPLLRKRAAQAYAYSIKAVTRDPLALGVIFDNGS